MWYFSTQFLKYNTVSWLLGNTVARTQSQTNWRPCSPCSLYFKKRGHARPAELNREIQRRCRKSDGAEENNNNVSAISPPLPVNWATTQKSGFFVLKSSRLFVIIWNPIFEPFQVPKRRYRKSEKVVVLDLESALEAIVPRQNYDDDGSSWISSWSHSPTVTRVSKTNFQITG